MADQADTAIVADPFQLIRFIDAQKSIYTDVLEELRRGRKKSHWMWFVFPQIEGLGNSTTAKRYAIRSLAEARQYLEHPVLGIRLKECSETLMAVEGKSITDVLGFPDDVKLQSSMTLFANLDKPDSVFAHVLEKYFNGEEDNKTLSWLYWERAGYSQGTDHC